MDFSRIIVNKSYHIIFNKDKECFIKLFKDKIFLFYQHKNNNKMQNKKNKK